MVVRVIDVHANDHGASHVECFFHHGNDLLRRFDHLSVCATSLRIFDVIDRTKIDAGFATLFQLLLDPYHVIGPVDPDQVDEMYLEANGCLQLHRRKEESAVT